MLAAPSRFNDADPVTRMQQLHDEHAGAVYQFLVRRTLGDRQAAQDLTQETMLRAWRHIDDLDLTFARLRAWLLTVARRVAIDAARARQARPTEINTIDPSILPAADDAVDRMLTAQTVRHALARLSPDHRRVLIEIYFGHRSTAETADLLGIPIGTVRSRTYYALRSLRQALVPGMR